MGRGAPSLTLLRRAWPYRDLSRGEFDEVVALHTSGRSALLHRDGVNGRLMATRRARMTALLSGGAIPDTADYQVRLEPEGTLVGTVNEDWAIESNGGDIFQLGNASWRILRVEPGIVRVADAKGQPPSIPFWLGEGPGRTRELALEIGTPPRRDGCRRGRGGRGVDPGRLRRSAPGGRGGPDRGVRRGREEASSAASRRRAA